MLPGPASSTFSYDDTTHLAHDRARPTCPAPVTAEDRDAGRPVAARALTRERFYFVMADRFANGDPTNDTGGLAGDRLATGFDPTDKGFYHGGDLAGLIDKLDYIEGLGTTAIWLTPSFKNRPVQGTGADVERRLPRLLDHRLHPDRPAPRHQRRDEASSSTRPTQRGMKVFFDIITNHTADVIDYAEGQYTYIDKATAPYRTPTATPFDDRDYAGGDDVPAARRRDVVPVHAGVPRPRPTRRSRSRPG